MVFGAMILSLLSALALALGIGAAANGVNQNRTIEWGMMGPAIGILWFAMGIGFLALLLALKGTGIT